MVSEFAIPSVWTEGVADATPSPNTEEIPIAAPSARILNETRAIERFSLSFSPSNRTHHKGPTSPLCSQVTNS